MVFLLRFVNWGRQAWRAGNRTSHKPLWRAYIEPAPWWVYAAGAVQSNPSKELKMSMMKKMTCRALVVSLLALSFQTANAGMIGAEQAQQVDRGMVLSVLSRAETAQQLQAQGIDPQMARERVASMTDQEVQALAQDMQTAPAGALSSGGWLAVVVIAGLIWYFAYRR
jgi:hypothetical protein